MKKFLFALLLLPLAQSTAVAPAALAAQAGQGGGAAALVGNTANGKMYWDSNLTACKNCHGGVAEGAFGPRQGSLIRPPRKASRGSLFMLTVP